MSNNCMRQFQKFLIDFCNYLMYFRYNTLTRAKNQVKKEKNKITYLFAYKAVEGC